MLQFFPWPCVTTATHTSLTLAQQQAPCSCQAKSQGLQDH
jgi:hypothetical protein